QVGLPSVGMKDPDVRQTALGDQPPSHPDGLVAPFHPHHFAARADPLSEQVETAARAAADLHDARSDRKTDLVEQPPRFLLELLRLPLQPFLLSVSVAEIVLVGLGHTPSPQLDGARSRARRVQFMARVPLLARRSAPARGRGPRART